MKTPCFWEKPDSVWTKLFSPAGKLYAWGTAYRIRRAKPYQAPVPVICVGNLSVGGTGKTPVCLALADTLAQLGQPFFFLSHGYKSKLKGILIDPEQHGAFEVGDEALLLAAKAPTVVDNQRARGAQVAVKNGAKCIVMDDGFQNPSLIKTLSFVVVDGKKGFGNEHVMPAGPLREPVLKGLARADAVIIVGDDEWGVRFFLQRSKSDLPILTGRFVPDETAINALKGQQVLAFAGIGMPEKFFNLLAQNGVSVAKTEHFPDHYFYTRFDVEGLMKKAAGMPIVTTTKDAVKIPKDLQKNITVVDGSFQFDNPEEVVELLKGVL